MISTDLEIDAYLASKRASHHKLRTLATKGARGYYIAHEQRKHSEDDTKAFRTGRAFEDALQRPAEYKARYIAKPEGMSFATKDGKAWRAEQEAASLSIVEGEDARAIEALLGTLESCPTAQRLMADATPQVTIYHEDVVRGRWDIPGIQSRPDWLCLEGSAASAWRPYAYDLKTTKSLADLCSGRAIVKYGYHRQAAMVRMCLDYEGVDVSGFRYLLLGAEKGFPHRWGVIEVPQQLIDVGQRWCEAQLDRLAEHYATGEWPLVSSEVLVADVPAWLDESEAA
jgi:hypothetical protein